MKYKKSVHRTFALITQLGISMIVPILLCVWVGGWLEEKFKLPVTIPFIILGVLAGMRRCGSTDRLPDCFSERSV